MGKPGKVVGVEIDYCAVDEATALWSVSLVRGKHPNREREVVAQEETLADARAQQDELMDVHDCPGWSTTAAAKQATDEDSVAELMAEGATPDEAWAQIAEWRKLAEELTADLPGVI